MLLLFLFVVSLSYAWGMRGSIIGGQKGVMLPGAIIGLFFAWSSGSDVFREYFYIFAAVGAAGIYFGGEMTYGETMGFTMKGIKEKGFFHGMTGLYIKGFLWLGLCAGFLGLCAGALTGEYYSAFDIIIFAALIMPLFMLGSFVINKNPEKGKMPKLYFSVTRGESWGGMLFVYAALLIMACLRGDLFTVYYMVLVSLLCGAAWVIAQLCYVYELLPIKGRYIFGSEKRRSMIDGWKIMETVFGALIAVSFCVSRYMLSGSFKEIVQTVEENTEQFQPLNGNEDIILIIWAVFFVLSVVYLCFNSRVSQKKLDELERDSLLTKEEYAAALIAVSKHKKRCLSDISESVSDFFAFLAFGCMPLLSCAGAHKLAMISCSFPLMWVLAERCGYLHFIFRKNRNILRAVMILICAAVLAVAYYWGFTAIQLWLIYTLSYYAMQVIWLFRPSRLKQYKENRKPVLRQIGSAVSVQAYFTVCVAIMLVMGFVVFK